MCATNSCLMPKRLRQRRENARIQPGHILIGIQNSSTTNENKANNNE